MAVFVSYSDGVPPGKIPDDAETFTAEVAKWVVWLHAIYSIAGLVLGLAFALLGVVLLLHGVAGTAGWVVQVLGLKSSLSDAAPGVVLAVIGVVVVFVTRFDIRVQK